MDLDLLEPKLGREFTALSPFLVLEYVGGCCGEWQVPRVSQGHGTVLPSEGGSSSSACE